MGFYPRGSMQRLLDAIERKEDLAKHVAALRRSVLMHTVRALIRMNMR
ncbi:Uncharacterised protein [uncultured archaeon]|nr:Uncharacterised protein [uncultured archaeon]